MKTIGDKGLSILKDFEKCVLTPYKDSGGVWTDGWGNTNGVDPNRVITQAEADDKLKSNLKEAIDCVNDKVTVDITQNQFDALVVFTFNVGCSAFSNSTLLRYLNSGTECSDQFERWNKVKGVVSKGLIRRRLAEQELFKEV